MKMEKLNFTNDSLRLSRSTAMDNDLAFFVAVLSEINDVISQTYGPEAGYVAQTNPNKGTYSYSKDGLTTLTNMRFNDPADHQVLNMVQDLAYRIKETSGDGSTTAAKLLFYMMKNALSYISNMDKGKAKLLRINTPKVINYLSDNIKEKLELWKNNDTTYDDLRDVALISLNNDESLMPPIDDLINHLKEKNAPVDNTLIVDAYKGYKDETEIDFNPGYVLGVNRFSIDSTLTGITDAKVIMIPNFWSYDYIHFILRDIVEAAQNFSKNLFIVFMISAMDDQTRTWVKKLFKQAQSNNETVRFEIIEMNATSTLDSERLEDIMYLLNTNMISLQSYVEKRDDVIEGDIIDHKDTTELVKWRKVNLPDGEIDKEWGKREYLKEYYDNFTKSFYCNIETRPKLGLTLSLSQTAIDKQMTPEYREMFNRHLESLKATAEGKDVEKAKEAANRLKYMKDNFYVLNVARRLGDDDRLYTQYKDAVRAITSVSSHGYYMGGSVGAYIAVRSSSDEEDALVKDLHNDLADTYNFIKTILLESFVDLILDLKYEFRNRYETEELELNDFVTTLIKEGTISPLEFIIGESRVIIPIETDLVMIPETLYIFSNLFSSLKIEFNNPEDAIRFHQLSTEVNKLISKKKNNEPELTKEEEPKEEIKEETPTPVIESKPEPVKEVKKEEKPSKPIVNKTPESKIKVVEKKEPEKVEIKQEKPSVREFFSDAIGLIDEEELEKNPLLTTIYELENFDYSGMNELEAETMRKINEQELRSIISRVYKNTMSNFTERADSGWEEVSEDY